MYEGTQGQKFAVRVGIPQQPIHSLVVEADDSASALSFILETVPQACFVTVKPS